MWGGSSSGPPAPTASYYGQPPPSSAPMQPPPQQQQQQQQQSSNNQQKHDVFVGNLAFSTTEEQLYTAFSEIGRIIKVRMVSDLETGKPRGFAFIEFEDPQAALSAIRNMNEYEINGRRIRVNFSNSSHLETLAGQLGMDLSHVTGGGNKGGGGGGGGDGKKDHGGMEDHHSHHHKSGGGHQGGGAAMGGVAGSKAVASALKSMNKGEMYGVVAKLKEICDSNPEEARKLLTQHPQLPEAILYCMSELDMIKTPISTSSIGLPATSDLSSMQTATAAKPSDPRARSQPPPPLSTQQQQQQQQPPPPPMAMPSDPRARPADPRAASRDPRASSSIAPPPMDPRAAASSAGGAPNFPPPPMMQPPPSMMPPPPQMTQPPPPMQPQPPQGGVAGLDPNLIQQVMSLTPMQIAQLPPDKQQSILALRQQITGAGM